MGTKQKSYRANYNEMITEIDEAFETLDSWFENGTISQDEYNAEKYQLTKDYSTILENKHYEDMIYDNITDENDKYRYESSVAFLSGDLSACEGSANVINNLYRTSPGVFESFTESPKPVQNRTFTMGEKYYNRTLNAAANKGIDFNKLGIKCNIDNGEFTVPKDPKAILQFAECYAIAGGYESDNGFWENIYAILGDVFVDTANNFFNGDTRIGDHDALIALGTTYNIARNNIKGIELNYGIKPYYMPLISPGNYDITAMQEYVFGKNSSEINLIADNLFDKIKLIDLNHYEIYANDADVIADNGGNAELVETNNPETKKELMRLIANAKKEDITFAFGTSGYEYGTILKINKNDGFVKCFVSKLLPSDQAEEYIRTPMFRAKAFLDIAKARNGGMTVAHRNFLGSDYSGSFHASNGKLFYRLDTDDDSKETYTYISDGEALALKTFSLMFEEMCLSKKRLNNVTNVELPNENDILRFITQTDENGDSTQGISLVGILSSITNESEEIITNKLMEHYRTYYK